MPVNPKFGQYIRELRERRGYSLERVGMKLGVSKQVVQHYEKGIASTPNLYTLVRMCEIYESSLSEMVNMLHESDPEKGEQFRYIWRYLHRHNTAPPDW